MKDAISDNKPSKPPALWLSIIGHRIISCVRGRGDRPPDIIAASGLFFAGSDAFADKRIAPIVKLKSCGSRAHNTLNAQARAAPLYLNTDSTLSARGGRHDFAFKLLRFGILLIIGLRTASTVGFKL
jgi:hypothetical protein